MNKRITILLAAACICLGNASAQDMYSEHRAEWMKIAEETTPELHYKEVKPVAVVKAVQDDDAFQGWRYEATGENPADLYERNFKEVKEITLDFGKHLVGYFSFHTKTLNRCQDAPIRFKFTFGELPAEINTPLDPWKGSLSRAWMQDEIVTVNQVDTTIVIPRRLACRYLRIELLAASNDFDFAIDDLTFTAQSSAGEVQTELMETCSDEIRKINDVSIETLRECMQTVYEDGPKRDQRLWSGDMYLESLANRYSFRNFEMTKHCLYLFAGLSADDGIVISNCFEKPKPHPQYGSYCLTYCLLWNSTLFEYLCDTGDLETGNDLWIVAKRQMEDALSYVDERDIFNQYARGSYVWLFFDWRDGLDVNTPMQGATIFALEQTYQLAKMLGRESEVAHYPEIAKKMRKAARKYLYDKEKGVFVSGSERQVSVLGQTWMIKADVLNEKEAQKAIRTALASDTTVMPGTPYATHYLIEAMIEAGMYDEARDYLTEYWGGMVDKGADTFWEAYDPEDDFISPYGFFPVNSACHAWSCTPVYFIHKYPEVFQR
ncbi:MAG: glycoside hydrolase [Bacteroidales bacterium]|nr:glycoside hydrolase [Bacteroidales bacterium]